MTQCEIQDAFINVLQEIQDASGFEKVEITGDTYPLNDLEGFDSLLCLDAIAMLAEKLDLDIPNDNNIFIDVSSKKQLTVKESSQIIHNLMKQK